MASQKVLEDYFEITIAKSNNWTCHKCNEKIEIGRSYLLMRRNRHIFCLCGKCVLLASSVVLEIDPLQGNSAQEKVVAHLL